MKLLAEHRTGHAHPAAMVGLQLRWRKGGCELATPAASPAVPKVPPHGESREPLSPTGVGASRAGGLRPHLETTAVCTVGFLQPSLTGPISEVRTDTPGAIFLSRATCFQRLGSRKGQRERERD